MYSETHPPPYDLTIHGTDHGTDPPPYSDDENDIDIDIEALEIRRPTYKGRLAEQCAWYEKIWDDGDHSFFERYTMDWRCCHWDAVDQLFGARYVYVNGPIGSKHKVAERRRTGRRLRRMKDGVVPARPNSSRERQDARRRLQEENIGFESYPRNGRSFVQRLFRSLLRLVIPA
ncbi:hypothetical protein LTR17_023251 [Elasticomyces elasticus]|nr:hypothetical protein LTR17_023251 [Elasticomyces elasticus]